MEMCAFLWRDRGLRHWRYLSQVASSARFYKRRARRQAQAVDVPPRFQVIQPIQYQVEFAEEVYAVLRFFDVCLARMLEYQASMMM